MSGDDRHAGCGDPAKAIDEWLRLGDPDIRTILGASDGESADDAARRVVAEREHCGDEIARLADFINEEHTA